MDQIAKFYEELGHQIKQFPGGIDALAEASGVSKVTLWRWVNGINLKYPDQHRVLQVLMATTNKRSISELKALFVEGEISNYLGTFGSRDYQTIVKDKDLNTIQDYYYFLIYVLTGNESGTSEDELIEICGNIAAKKAEFEDLSLEAIRELGRLVLPKIKELETRELIFLKDGRYYRNQKELYFPLDEKKLFKYLLENLENFAKPKDFPLGFNAFYGSTESITPSMAKELALDTKNFFTECNKKMERAKCINGVPYQILFTAERMGFYSNNQIKEIC